MRELTQEIKDKIKADVLIDLHPALLNNKQLIKTIINQREELYKNNEMEVSLDG